MRRMFVGSARKGDTDARDQDSRGRALAPNISCSKKNQWIERAVEKALNEIGAVARELVRRDSLARDTADERRVLVTLTSQGLELRARAQKVPAMLLAVLGIDERMKSPNCAASSAIWSTR